MTLEEKKELINSANSLEELEERKAQIEEEENKVEEEVKEEVTEEPAEEVKEEITPEEERSLLKDTQNVESRNAENLELRSIERKEKMEEKVEVRNSKEYIEAFANYIKTGEDKEVRALITTGGYATGNSATVEVPDMVYDIVKTAWEREELMARVRNISVKGNLKVQFEVSGDAAVIHQEGNSAVTEESLVLGVVTLTPVSIRSGFLYQMKL